MVILILMVKNIVILSILKMKLNFQVSSSYLIRIIGNTSEIIKWFYCNSKSDFSEFIFFAHYLAYPLPYIYNQIQIPTLLFVSPLPLPPPTRPLISNWLPDCIYSPTHPPTSACLHMPPIQHRTSTTCARLSITTCLQTCQYTYEQVHSLFTTEKLYCEFIEYFVTHSYHKFVQSARWKYLFQFVRFLHVFTVLISQNMWRNLMTQNVRKMKVR